MRRYFIFKVLENSKENTKSSIMHEEYPLYANVLCWYSVLGNKKGAYMLPRLTAVLILMHENGMECGQLGQAKFSLLNLVILLILLAKFSLSPYKMYGAYWSNAEL